VDSEKIPEANMIVQQRLDDLLNDPIAYLERERLASLRAARIYVDRQVSKKLAEQQLSRGPLGQRLLRGLGKAVRKVIFPGQPLLAYRGR
jgi:hypothetical protein